MSTTHPSTSNGHRFNGLNIPSLQAHDRARILLNEILDTFENASSSTRPLQLIARVRSLNCNLPELEDDRMFETAVGVRTLIQRLNESRNAVTARATTDCFEQLLQLPELVLQNQVMSYLENCDLYAVLATSKNNPLAASSLCAINFRWNELKKSPLFSRIRKTRRFSGNPTLNKLAVWLRTPKGFRNLMRAVQEHGVHFLPSNRLNHPTADRTLYFETLKKITLVYETVAPNYVPLDILLDSPLLNDQESVRALVSGSSVILEYVNDQFRDDEQVVRLAVQQDGFALQYASDRLRDNEEVVRLAIQNWAGALQHASDRLRDNEEVVRLAVQNWGDTLQHASDRLRDNEEVVRLAVQNWGEALLHASDRLRDNEEIVRLAVQQAGMALDFASERLQTSEAIVRLAIENTCLARCLVRDRPPNI